MVSGHLHKECGDNPGLPVQKQLEHHACEGPQHAVLRPTLMMEVIMEHADWELLGWLVFAAFMAGLAACAIFCAEERRDGSGDGKE